ncbi:putative aldose-1-epimerase [Actinoplanes missouriensis 431]|uniref:Putative aldose-1-epimerase n=1 Tax=Actinoplanes missouriensis (strain ATCC 14538 / DSM 43046 / CBS 188.64 / JCM 3121 / NBRC 102363 / NCIMB 12654 / NRRL B-3342 / UNCC 431) TaxID=512565 RepID=I0GXX5_ACTM4|nr:aldose 1-epimerase family protein [Actinoplanes missouriensis]BAL85612.1 putative aldose-1-epimerase [Actinoplanes missouriensis 431]
MSAEAAAKSGIQWSIEADGHRAVLTEVGGTLRAYSVNGAELLDGFGTDEIAPGSAGQILAPWPNRIRDGHYQFEGQTYQLALTEPARHNAIHGLVNWSRWRLAEQSAGAVTLEYELPAQVGYPWSLVLRSHWSVSADGLRCVQDVVNTSGSNAPWGYSVHPYLRLAGVSVDDTVLHVPARSRLLADNRLLPLGANKVAGTEFDYNEPRRIGSAVLDTTFGDIDFDADGITAVTLSSGDAGSKIVVWADDKFKYWQVFTGDTLHGERHRRAVAVEPMTCPPDAFRSGRDLVVLEPGQTWTTSWGIRA